MNINYFIVYTIFALLSVILTLFITTKLSNSLTSKINPEINNFNGITLCCIYIGCAILFIDLFQLLSSTLHALDMQKVRLYGEDTIKLLLTFLLIIVSGIVLNIFISFLIFKIIIPQVKEANSIIRYSLYGIIFIIITIVMKPLVFDLLNYFQPTIQTPFFK